MLLLPFTAGGFLYIAMVSLLPTFLEEKDKMQAIFVIFFKFELKCCISKAVNLGKT